jgi:predicted O-linked N-acetylglucosamine transferase (SPINDLY family)
MAAQTGLDARLHYEDGTAWMAHGQIERAEAAFRAAIALRPSLAEAHCNLGILLCQRGRLAEAAHSFAAAIRHRPELVEAHNNLGNVQKDLGRRTDALRAYRQALRQRRDYAPAHYNLGLALLEGGEAGPASAHLRAALICSPDHVAAHHDYGNALRRLGAAERSLLSYRRALRVHPRYADALCNLAIALQQLGLTDQSRQAFVQTLQLQADHVEALQGLGALLRGAGLLQDAIGFLRQAVQLRPDFAEAWINLSNALADQGHLAEADQAYRQALQRHPDHAAAAANLLVNGCYQGECGLADLQQRAQDWSRIAAQPAAPRPPRRKGAAPRIGLVSADFRAHPVGMLAIGAVEALAGAGIALSCYSNGSLQDDMTARYRRAAQWRDIVGVTDQQAAAQIRRDQIDILIDLSGHSDGNRLGLFALRPAHLQVSWLGFPATTGLAAMDALLSDPYQVPLAAEPFYAEKILRLPHCWAPFEPPRDEPPVGLLPALSNGVVTFGSFNAVKKISPEMVALWSQLLQRQPDSRLIVKAAAMQCAATRQLLLARFAAHGVSADRLDLVGATSLADHRAWMRRADIALDPFPFSGGITTLDSLWSGLPVVTRSGETFSSRDSMGFLAAIGCDHLVAEDNAGYLACADRLAADLAALDGLRQSLRPRMLASKLCDAEQFGQDLLRVLSDVWQKQGSEGKA